MYLSINNRTELKVDFSQVESIYERAKICGLLPSDFELELCLCDSEFICYHNKVFRGVEQKTDVLSFELSSTSGSLLICLEYLLQRSGESGLQKDLQEVFAHGLCHLAGMDHLTAKQKEVMQSQENFLLQAK